MDQITMWDVLKWGWSVVIPHNWYLHRRLDKIQDEHVKRKEFTETVESIRNEIREGNQQITQRLDSLLNTMIQNK